MFSLLDIFAALLLTLSMMRHLEAKRARSELYPAVPREQFERWRALALRGFGRAAVACAAMVVASNAWLLVATRWLALTNRSHELVFRLVGLAIFIGWVVALVSAWRIITDASHLRRQLGIERRPPPPA